jgi:general stress protein 26
MAATDVKLVWKLASKISICMLANWDGQELRSRPMGAYVRPEENAIYFLTDSHHHKDDDIARYPKVCLSFADPGDQKYVSIAGDAVVSRDRAKVHELWSTPAKAWWNSPDDPDIRILKVTPHDAQYWDSPGTIVSYVKMAVAAMTDSRPNVGKNEKVAM